MVVNIKKVILKFIGTGIDDMYQACVNIYDTDGNLLFQGKTYNGELTLYLGEDNIYKLTAVSCKDVMRVFFCVSQFRDKYIFIFSRYFVQSNSPSLRTITFLLTDANYDNLLIEKGEMVLWQK